MNLSYVAHVGNKIMPQVFSLVSGKISYYEEMRFGLCCFVFEARDCPLHGSRTQERNW